jgi:hypothetical protein
MLPYTCQPNLGTSFSAILWLGNSNFFKLTLTKYQYFQWLVKAMTIESFDLGKLRLWMTINIYFG